MSHKSNCINRKVHARMSTVDCGGIKTTTQFEYYTLMISVNNYVTQDMESVNIIKINLLSQKFENGQNLPFIKLFVQMMWDDIICEERKLNRLRIQ